MTSAGYRLRLQYAGGTKVLGSGEFLLGRGLFCDVVIDGPSVSRRHARILAKGGRATITDLGSRNGVFVNGAVAWREHPLSDGDVLKLGSEEIQVTFDAVSEAEDRNSLHAEETHTSTFRTDITDEAPSSRRLDDVAMAVRLARRAFEAGDTTDADRLMRRQVWALVRTSNSRRDVDAKTFDAVLDLVLKLAVEQRAARWLESAVTLLAARRAPLDEPLVERLKAALSHLAPVEIAGLREYQEALHLGTGGDSDPDLDRRFRELREAARQSTSRR